MNKQKNNNNKKQTKNVQKSKGMNNWECNERRKLIDTENNAVAGIVVNFLPLNY